MLRIVLLLLLIPPFGVAGAAWAAAVATCVDQGAMLVMALHRLRIHFGAFVGHIVRPLLAAAVMTFGVLAITRSLQPMPEADVAWPLLIEVSAGAVIYTAVLLVAWLAAGRPEGPESDALHALRRTVARA